MAGPWLSVCLAVSCLRHARKGWQRNSNMIAKKYIAFLFIFVTVHGTWHQEAIVCEKYKKAKVNYVKVAAYVYILSIQCGKFAQIK